MEKTKFYYFICNIGSEAFLKEEIALFHPELRFSFSTKGFVTFKLVENKLRHFDFVFCRHFGEFICKGSREEILNQIELIKNTKSFKGEVIEYDLSSLDTLNLPPLAMGTEVLEIIKIKENEYYLGSFNVLKFSDQYAAGVFNIPLPEKSPSRAYLKILEGAKKVGVEFKKGETALEIGSSPGGATYALLMNELNVIGIDPGIMDPICKEFKTFKHFHQSIQDFDTKNIKQKIDWLLVDMNLAPEATLAEIEKVLLAIRFDFKGAFITIKMTKIELISRLPFYKKLIQRMGLHPVQLCQLPSHKQEFLMFVQMKE